MVAASRDIGAMLVSRFGNNAHRVDETAFARIEPNRQSLLWRVASMGSMMTSSRAVVTGGLLALGIAAVVSGQGGQPAASRTPMDELLVEVRAIRADLDRAAAASLRGQLLGMRLQLQEQRIAALSRQLSDVQERLRANQQARTSLATALSMFGGNKEQPSADERQAMNMVFGPMKQQVAALDKADADLKVEESALIGQLQEEQNRWTTFNGQVEELERASAGRNIRQTPEP